MTRPTRTLILASASPRRSELLTQAGFRFEVRTSQVAEDLLPGEDPIAAAVRLARLKAESVRQALPPSHGEAVILGADTIVVSPAGEILGKPIDVADAARMLRSLSGATHRVATGVCVVTPQVVEVACAITAVSMLTLSDAEIAAYIATGEPADKAGAYAIQGRAARWIPRINGDYTNVVGLPVALVATMLEAAGILPVALAVRSGSGRC